MHFLEFPLVIFTVLAQCAVGAYLLITTRLACVKDELALNDLAIKSLFFVLGFMAIGFGASTMHLGSPLRAFNSLNRVGASGLSNEILTGSVFFAFAGFYWLSEVLTSLGKEWIGKGLRTALRYLGAISGVIFMAAMVKVYLINTVPLWDTIFTPIEFTFTVITAGLLFGYVLLNAFNGSSIKANKMIAVTGILLIAIHFIVMIARVLDFSGVVTSIHQGITALDEYSAMIMTQCVLMLIAAVLWAVSAHQTNNKVRFYSILALFALIAAEIFGRGVFYGMHFTFGLI
ncbi:dimethyl sulfoxide reductase anchor subunit family protein [Vibrio rumoiensis]|uniref:Dimethyl sulfoxide reductase n=1 Tax=Vibrio rumoiensis 1S-45 TaxID=1188252 RepID=A0A1E5E2I0_9VIBR|nr:DmsC/YnfH family molybdoenzyme membrane anchor subunit [Vibrio rumoiensis]OEF25742.1 dimethyl sulfoxide reductase [Vibrio rumoiensis 1S-45]